MLGSRLIELGSMALAQMPLTAIARALIERLAAQTGDTVHLSVRDGDEVVYVDKIGGTRGLEMRSAIGLRKPIALTGTGKAMMLDLPEQEWARIYKTAKAEISLEKPKPPGFLPWARFVADMRLYQERGYTMEKEENQASIVCIGAPIRDARNSIVAGLSIASAAIFMPPQRMVNLIPATQSCAIEISKGLGFAVESADNWRKWSDFTSAITRRSTLNAGHSFKSSMTERNNLIFGISRKPQIWPHGAI